MKKLLSLLSALTISGGAVPTTIAASHYQKEEILKIIKKDNSENLKFKKNNLSNFNFLEKVYNKNNNN